MKSTLLLLVILFNFSAVAFGQQIDWAMGIGGPAADNANAMTTDAAGNIYVTGGFQGTDIDFDPGPGTANLSSNGGFDVYFAKYNAAGELLWARSFGNSDSDLGQSISTDAGGVYVSGYFNNTLQFTNEQGSYTLKSNGGDDIFLIKFDLNSGEFIWGFSLGLFFTDRAYSVISDGTDVYLAGDYAYVVDFDPGGGTYELSSIQATSDIFIAKYKASDGSFVWAKSLGGTGNNSAKSLALDETGVYVSGSFYGTADFDPGENTVNLVSAGSSEGFIAKYDPDGNYLWANRIGGAGNDKGSDIALYDSRLYVCGSFESDAEFNAAGGTPHSLTSKGRTDIFIASYEATDGSLNWAKSMGGPQFDEGTGLWVDASGLYVTGRFEDTADFNFAGEETVRYTSKGYRDAFIAHYTPEHGSYVWSKALGSIGFNVANTITKKGNSVYVAGSFQETLLLEEEGMTDLQSAGSSDIFFLSFQSAVPLAPPNHQPTLDVMENPAEIEKNADVQRIQLTGISSGDEGDQQITITASSDNPALIPHPVVFYTSPEASALLEYKPNTDMTGSAIITVRVTDNGTPPAYIERTFQVRVSEITAVADNDLSRYIITWMNTKENITYLKSTQVLTNVKLSLLNLNGKKVWEEKVKELREMPLHTKQQAGVYIIQIESVNKAFHKKIYLP